MDQPRVRAPQSPWPGVCTGQRAPGPQACGAEGSVKEAGEVNSLVSESRETGGTRVGEVLDLKEAGIRTNEKEKELGRHKP